jgi:tetratricopeptide (TPR) repeat protein
VTPDTWFFRGLAIHFVDAAAAIDSYREANALRARQHGFYPQAVLHLARARNQQLYSTRSLEPFSEAQASLRQLAEQGYYEALPYYYLSIAHRLAAEIYKGSEGTRDQLVAENYTQALDWARRGQQVDPADDRPITAEAECLESMGRYAEAIEARDRAIAVADAEVKRCEAYHYRWRLYYWTGNLEAALADVDAHAICDPNSPAYAHVYPALLQAETGDWPAALAHARALAADAPRSAQAVLWSATCLRLLGQPQEAADLLVSKADTVNYAAGLMPPQTEAWVHALYTYCQEGGALTTLEELAGQSPTPWKLLSEAYFHAAAMRLADGDRAGALHAFQRAYRSFDGEERYTYQAKLFCVQMQKNLAWPPWIPVSYSSGPGGLADPTAAESLTSAPEERNSP